MRRDIINMMLSKHTLKQRVNYVRYLLAEKGERLPYDPITISIVATTRCTLSCDMCPTHSSRVPEDYEHTQKNVRDIDFDIFKDIIDRFDKATTVHVIGSGEPLLNKDFFRMVDYAAGKKMTVKTFSNGTTIEKHMDDILNSRLDGITISLNGQNAPEFKRMTGMPEDVYSQIYDATKKLISEKKRRGSKVKVKLSFIVDMENYKAIPEMVDTGLKLGADHIFFCNFLPSPYGGLSAKERVLMAVDSVETEVKSIFGKYSPLIRKKLTPPVLVAPDLRENRCSTHFSQIRFDGDGNVSSCSMMLLDMSGNGTYKEKDVWNNEFFRNARKAFLGRGEAKIKDPCKVCPDNKGVVIKS